MPILDSTLHKPTFAVFHIHAFKYKNQSRSITEVKKLKLKYINMQYSDLCIFVCEIFH